MQRAKILVVFFCIAMLLSGTAFAGNQNLLPDGEPNIAIYPALKGASNQLARDEDEFMTYRFVVSTDGGESWSEIRGTGDTGMWDGEDPGWGDAGYNFGSVVDAENNIHFIGVLDAYEEGNEMQRVNGLYDIKSNVAGDEVTYTLIAELPEDTKFTWSDAGKSVDGDLIAMWEVQANDAREFWAATMSDGSWGDSFVIAEELADEDHYPHMTDMNGDNMYVLFQTANADSGWWDHFVIKVNAGQATTYGPITESGTEVSYYTSAVNPIAQDVDAGVVYFAVRNRDVSGTAVASTDDGGENWTVETIPGAQRYPSAGVDGSSPWVFSNIGIPAADSVGNYPNHYNWVALDANGYGGGDWFGPDAVMEIAYPGEVYYTAMGAFLDDGRMVMGCNVWSYPDPVLTPSAFMVNYSDDMGESWSDTMRIVDYIADGLNAGYLPQMGMNVGTDNTIFVTFCGLYGITDVYAPMVDDASLTLSSTVIGEEWVSTCNLMDEDQGATGISYADINWVNTNAEGDIGWEYVEGEAVEVDDDGNGSYRFVMPSDTMHGQAIAVSDTILFFIFIQDGVGNAGEGELHRIVVGQDWVNGVDDFVVELPTSVSLGQNYPNPFNNSTVIPFTLNRAAEVNLSVYDINGRLIETLFNGQATAGNHEVAWRGEGATSGVYFYVLNSPTQRKIAKMTLIR